MNSIRHGVSLLALGACLGVVAQPFLATPAHAQSASQEKRIEALEAQVEALTAEIRREHAAAPAPRRKGKHPAVVAEAPPPVPQYSAPPPMRVAGTGGAGGNSPMSSDIPGPSTANGAGSIIPGASIVGGKPSIASADGRFIANLHGVMQFDAAGYLQNNSGNNVRGGAAGDTGHAQQLSSGTDFRRARIGIDGKAFGDFDYNILFDFGGAGAEDAGHVQELWAQYSGFKPFHLRIGAFQPSFGLEDQGSTNGMPFLERPAVTDVARSLSASDYREGAELWAATKRAYGAFALTTRNVGTFNSTSSPVTQSFDQAFGAVARVAYLPYESADALVHVGAHGSYAFRIADATGPNSLFTSRYAVDFRIQPELRVDATRLVDTGNINAKHVYDGGLELAGQYRNFYAQGEYENFGIDRRDSSLSDPHFDGFYAEGSWVLTGEKRKYNKNTFAFDAPAVNHPFDLRQGTIGAVELALRYSDINLNYKAGQAGQADPLGGVRGGHQKIFAAGVNWYFNPLIRMMFDYQHVDVDRLSPSATTYLTPVGAQIGQAYNTVSIRTQLAF